MSVKPLRSHNTPDLFLHEHVGQVIAAMQGIRGWHSERLMTPEITELCRKAACMHDLGKGSAAFQEYIDDPENYKDDPAEKSHTPLSLLLMLCKAEAEDQDPLATLLLSASLYGHHSGFPILPARDGAPAERKTLDRFGADRMYRVLPRQLKSTDYAALANETGISLPDIAPDSKSVRTAKNYLKKKIFPALRLLTTEEAVAFRLKAQLVFSMLSEADKAFLAVRDPAQYLSREPRLWKADWIDREIGTPEETALNRLRQKARKAVQGRTIENRQSSLHSLTAPTGLGKTLLAADWALKNREMAASDGQPPPKVIVVLPFLSIIDQTARVYKSLLRFGTETPDGSWFLTSHSLSDRKYDTDSDENTAGFFINTWRTELVLTTYDQFLMSLIDPKARYQMRFHNLCDALIIMDEVQSVPCHMWQLLNGVFEMLSRTCNSKILLMSATLPPFVPDARPLLEDYTDYFSFRRYRFCFRLDNPRHIDDFCDEIAERVADWLEDGERVLITLNTRKSARTVYDCLKKEGIWPSEYCHVPLYFISADVTPKDRLEKIAAIKKGDPCIVVSTQCIEAGVDIDMTRVIRDFAPWDSLVQIAGRCNREGKRGEYAGVEVVDLADNNENRYANMIYDEVHLSATRQIIGDREDMGEEDTLAASELYFQKLNEAKDTGREHLERFAYWEEDDPVRELLRGKQREQWTFLVIEQDEELLTEMEAASNIRDRWKRREAWRKLAGRIARISVSLYARWGFRPEEIATEKMGHYILNYGYYDSDCGLLPESRYADSHNTSLIF